MCVAVHPARDVGLDVELNDGAPVLERHAADLADLHSGDIDRLPLPGGDRLCVLELGEDPGLALPGEAEPLVHAHVKRDRYGEPDHGDQREEVLQVAADDLAERHGSTFCASAGPVCALRLGSC